MTTTKTKPPSKSQIADQLRKARYACQRVCDKRCLDRINPDRPRDNQRAFRELSEAIEQGEREHMAFGSRMLGHRPARKSTQATRVAYFVVHLLAVEEHETPEWDQLYGIRRDWFLAIGLQHAIGRDTFRKAISDAGCDLALLDSLDYAKDLA